MKRNIFWSVSLICSLILVIGCTKQIKNMSGVWSGSVDWEGCGRSGKFPRIYEIEQQGDTIIITALDNKVALKGTKKGNVIFFRGGTFPIAQDGSDMTFQDWQMTISEDGNSAKVTANWILDRYGCPGVSKITYKRKE